MRGPYDSGPYVYVCQECWSKPFLFFPDKEITEDGLTRVPRSEELEYQKTSVGFAVLGSTVRLYVSPEAALEGEIVELGLAALRLDSSNVRFRDRKRALEDRELEEAIWGEAATKNLMREILASRGLSEMPIVDSRMVVREGNRRIVCLRRLSKLANEKRLVGVQPNTFDKLLAIVLRPEIDERDIALYLARVHVGGKRQWMAVNKAAHVFELHTRDDMSFDQIWQFLSINRSTAERMINAYRDTIAYREKYPDEPGWASKYSYFDEIYKRSDLRGWIERNANRRRLMEWIYRERIRTGLDIRKLPLILADKYATKLLDRAGAEKAYAYLAKKDPRLTDDFYRRMSEVIKTIQRIDGRQLLLAARDTNRARLIRSLSESSLRLTNAIERIQKSRGSAGKKGRR
jgi:hypothetical protein